MLNLLSLVDLIQDFFGLLMGVFINPYLLIASVPMIIFDIYSIWIVSIEKPFIFFESEILKILILASIMLCDIFYDSFWLAFWALFALENKFFLGFAVMSFIIYFTDVYEIYIFIQDYNIGFEEDETEFKKIE